MEGKGANGRNELNEFERGTEMERIGKTNVKAEIVPLCSSVFWHSGDPIERKRMEMEWG